MDILADLLARPVPSLIVGTAEWRSFNKHEQFEFEIDHQRERWSVRSLTTGSSSSFNDGVIVRDGRRMPSPYYRDQVIGPALQLLIPERLPTWGRPGDLFDPIGREGQNGDEELVTVQRRGDVASRNILVLDKRNAIVSRYHDTFSVTSIFIERADQPLITKAFNLDRLRASGSTSRAP